MPNAALEALACGTPVIGSGTIAALGDLAAAGAPVTSVHDDEALRRACLDIRPLGPPEAPRPSSLPHGYEVRGATATFAAAVLAAAPRPTQGPGLGSAP
jgi:glycosyltransferase involved in cell wall biosynthesis